VFYFDNFWWLDTRDTATLKNWAVHPPCLSSCPYTLFLLPEAS